MNKCIPMGTQRLSPHRTKSHAKNAPPSVVMPATPSLSSALPPEGNPEVSDAEEHPRPGRQGEFQTVTVTTDGRSEPLRGWPAPPGRRPARHGLVPAS